MKPAASFSIAATVVASATTLIALFPVTRAISKVDPNLFDLATEQFLSKALVRIAFGLILVGVALYLRPSRPKTALILLCATPILAFVADIGLLVVQR